MSATLAANEALDRRRREGLPVLPMAFGEAGLPVHPLLLDELRAAARHNGYGPVAGVPELRAAAAGYWSRRGLPTEAEQVVVGPGSKPLLLALRLAIGGDLVIPRPHWVSYPAQARMLGSFPWSVDTLPDQGGVPAPAGVREAVACARAGGRQVRQVLVTLPDNPTGTMACADTVRELQQAVREHDLVTVSDEIYRDLVHDDPSEYVSPAQFAPERTVITTGLSKSVALGGWRLGVCRFPDSALGHDLRERTIGMVSEIWSSAAAPVQYAGALAFSEPAELRAHTRRSAALHAAVTRGVAERLTRAGARVPRPQGGFYLYPDLGGRRDHLARAHEVSDSRQLAAWLLDRHGVGTLPGADFGDDPQALRLRMATSLLYGADDEQRNAALAADDPCELPWIAGSLDALEEAMSDLLTASPVGAGAPVR